MAYVPMQPWEIPFDPAESLQSGTIFPSLFLPFKGGARK
ncbi:MAG: spore coat associated protein CotJA [Firmicutes bacterium]|nr:spore coat associated protein CotJA [Bacillota bacterium]